MSVPTPPKIRQIGHRPIIDYVTKDYDGFREGMLGLIPQLLPGWTDRSERDFGVVLIELYAYVADILSYYQDRVANEAYLGTATQRRSVAELLALIGYQIDPGLAASTILHVEVSDDLDVTEAELPYRVKTAGIPGTPDRIFEVTRPFSLHKRNNALALEGTLEAGTSSARLTSASHALAVGDRVYLEERHDDGTGAIRVRRSSVLQLVDVQTVAGAVVVRWLPALTERFEPGETELKGNNVVASHGETISDEPVYVSDGSPLQTIRLTRQPVTHLLAVRGRQRRRRSAPELQLRIDGVLWEEVETFFASGPFDTHYTVSIDEDDVFTIKLGSGQRGAIPPAGVPIRAVYRVGLGRGGNVGSHRLSVPITSLAKVTAVTNPFAAEGGSDRETIEEAKISGPGSVIAQDRAVTLRDYELLAEGFAGVGKAKARVGLRGGYKVVQVYVAPEDADSLPPPLPSADLKEALKQELEARQPVNRMAGVDVLDPRYVAIDIAVDVHVKVEASASAVKAEVRRALEELLSFARVDFGSAIRVGDVYAALYPIDGISFVQVRRVARAGAAPAVPPGACGACEVEDVALTENELPYRGTLTIAPFGGGA